MPSKGKNRDNNLEKCSSGSSKVKASITNTSTSFSPKLDHQFEAELCWCIQQIQIALKSGKLNNKQEQDHIKTLNTLMSNSAQLVKKRQIMRLSFGDYRAKMAAEDKKYSRNALNMKVKQTMPSKKSIFVKKSNYACSRNKLLSGSYNCDELNNGMQNVKIEPSKDSHQNRKDVSFVSSDNNFRFSFDVSENT